MGTANSSPYRVGLTGGIASGTTIATMFANWACPSSIPMSSRATSFAGTAGTGRNS
ncbi:MAG: hypothetical protein U5K76_13765 [Woeseiaceae bacterium]|nr:hypothetical protein [Woeseiaceae bacterium]